MSRRTLMIAGLSATFAFAGGYALLDSMQPATTRTQASNHSADPAKVVAIPGSSLVPLNDGWTEWTLVGPDGTVLAGPDGSPPTGSQATGTPDDFLDGLVGTYLEGFPGGFQDAYSVSQEDWDQDEGRDHEDGDDYDDDDDYDHENDSDHDDEDDDDDHDHRDGYALSGNAYTVEKARARSRK